MKIIKSLVIGIVAILAILLIAALFVKNDYAVERSIVINKPKQTVFDFVKMVGNQDYFSRWNMMDPNMKKTRKGVDGTVGFKAGWESKDKNLGVGEQEITKIVEGERMESILRFKEPFEAEDNAYFATEAINDSTTKVKWGFTGAFDYPMNLMGLVMDMEKEIGGDFEFGLKNLKNVLEKQ